MHVPSLSSISFVVFVLDQEYSDKKGKPIRNKHFPFFLNNLLNFAYIGLKFSPNVGYIM